MDGYFLTKKLACIGRNDIDHSILKVGDHAHFRRVYNNIDNRFAINIVKYIGEDCNNEIIVGHVHAIHSMMISPLLDSYVRRSLMEVDGNILKLWDGERMEVNIDFFSRNNGRDEENMISDVKHSLRTIDGFIMNMYWWEN